VAQSAITEYAQAAEQNRYEVEQGVKKPAGDTRLRADHRRNGWS
jgi:hypothetical protein